MIGATTREKVRENLDNSSMPEAAEAGSLVESIYQTLLQGILNGYYPDQAVLSELALAADWALAALLSMTLSGSRRKTGS